ncbi:ATP-binding protein [Diaphorobacter ruginosibacter]|uniref:ATP-binding protein n=1 Tax=Diaphorobacter ruginosibacter TaxID=1715720 RepID=A0A7G9RIY6_9BURK|nr:ATP-binding protein [Diaphorobacter ruginosibacter]QNN55561.1 ATP-binding protein [Diaphorobacter ruginosibacter]
MIRSQRDLGYEFAAAVADLIDNSIEAKASTVRVNVDWLGAATTVTIADNGEGMSPEQLREALRFGSERDYDDADLGKFGLGLKTASLSQCLRLTVATRRNPNRADITAYCWDVEHVEAINRWEILPVKTSTLPPQALSHLKETTGTVVIWERLDRILGYKYPSGEHAKKHLFAVTREMEEHASMVFHRFLAGEVRGKRLAIYVNENKLVPWDPFARSEVETKVLESNAFPVDGSKGRSVVIVEPYVLPPEAKFSTKEAHIRSAGPRKWNMQQGFYIYRADRMIQSGGWCGLRVVDEHRKLSRIAVSFNPKLDEEFEINVPKMRVALPSEIRAEIERWTKPAVKMAEDIYRTGNTRKPQPVAGPVSVPAGLGGQVARTSHPSIPSALPLVDGPSPKMPKRRATRQELDMVADLLIQVAEASEIAAVENAIARARTKLESQF